MKTLIIAITFIASVCSAFAQCDTTFPMLSSESGRIMCNSEYRYSLSYEGISDDYHTSNSLFVARMHHDFENYLFVPWDLDCKPATSKLTHTKTKLINFGFNNDTTDFDYYISEFIDPVSKLMLAVEYGSIHNSVLPSSNLRESYLLPIDRVDPYINFHKGNILSEVMKYSDTNGSYLYEIYDNNTLCGIRYYSVTNQKEYKMFFK